MPDALLLTLALLCCAAGLGWYALSMEVHWKQACGKRSRSPGSIRVMRVLGPVALFAALLLCLRVDHASMAVLVWFMALAASALLIAFTLAWRPRWLSPLVIWAR